MQLWPRSGCTCEASIFCLSIPTLNMTPETRASLFEIAEENAEELYEQYGAEGTCVPKEDDLPSDPEEFTQRELKQVFSPQRLDDVLNGQPATEVELQALRQVRLDSISMTDCDADAIPDYCIAEVANEDGNSGIALILCTGYSFSGLNIWVDEIFDTREAAKAYAKERGWTS